MPTSPKPRAPASNPGRAGTFTRARKRLPPAGTRQTQPQPAASAPLPGAEVPAPPSLTSHWRVLAPRSPRGQPPGEPPRLFSAASVLSCLDLPRRYSGVRPRLLRPSSRGRSASLERSGSASLGSVADSVTLGKSCLLGLRLPIYTRELGWEVNLMS